MARWKIALNFTGLWYTLWSLYQRGDLETVLRKVKLEIRGKIDQYLCDPLHLNAGTKWEEDPEYVWAFPQRDHFNLFAIYLCGHLLSLDSFRTDLWDVKNLDWNPQSWNHFKRSFKRSHRIVHSIFLQKNCRFLKNSGGSSIFERFSTSYKRIR